MFYLVTPYINTFSSTILDNIDTYQVVRYNLRSVERKESIANKVFSILFLPINKDRVKELDIPKRCLSLLSLYNRVDNNNNNIDNNILSNELVADIDPFVSPTKYIQLAIYDLLDIDTLRLSLFSDDSDDKGYKENFYRDEQGRSKGVEEYTKSLFLSISILSSIQVYN